jgi:hypothetical protein
VTVELDDAVYATSPIKKRTRFTKAQLAELDTAIYDVCRVEKPISVRGVFYRVMSRGLVGKTEANVDRVQRRILKMRRAGELPYSWITDGTRLQLRPSTWSSAGELLRNSAASYRRALWDTQKIHLEIWSEKDAIRGVVLPVTREWDVPLMIARGFSSETFLFETAQEIIEDGKLAVIYNLGDHDGAGLHAWKDVQRKLTGFAPKIEFQFERLAVTPGQIAEYNLPTRPPKSKGDPANCVEVDALPSDVLRRVVGDAIDFWIDHDALDATRVMEARERRGLEALAGRGLTDLDAN